MNKVLLLNVYSMNKIPNCTLSHSRDNDKGELLEDIQLQFADKEDILATQKANLLTKKAVWQQRRPIC